MISIDPRIGSKHLLPLLTRRGLPAKFQKMLYGDVAFLGNGPRGPGARVGIEIKRLPDLVQSIQNKRLVGHQLPGLIREYDFPLLIVESTFGPADDDSILELRHGGRGFKPRWQHIESGMTHQAVLMFLCTVLFRARVPWIVTSGTRQTVAVLSTLYRWFTRKKWDDHESHLDFDRSHQSCKTYPDGSSEWFDSALFFKPKFVHRVAKELSGIGRKRTRRVSRRFKSAYKLINATEDDWLNPKIPGIGKRTVARILAEIRKEDG